MAVTNPTRGNGANEKKMTPEIYFARKLASNEKKVREKTLKKLKRWITARSAVPEAFNEEELMKLWKGLFYCMWMSDKALIQEDLAEMIASLVHCVADRKTGIKFVDAALKILARDWPGIDVWRMDKFLMFVRRIIRHSLEYIANEGWKEDEVAAYAEMLSNTVINANQSTTTLKIPIGLQLHIISLFPEELAKAGGSDMSSEIIMKILEPFVRCLAVSNDFRLRKDIIEHVFIYLIKQSDEGIEYEESGTVSAPKKGSKNKAKKARVEDEEAEDVNENTGGSDGEAEGADSEDDNENAEMDEEGGNPEWGAKDPRAGGVDVVLPQLTPDYASLANMIFKMASEKKVRSKNRKAMYRLVQWFKDLATGVYPLAVQMPEVGPGLTPKMMKKAAQAYIKDELTLSEQRALEKELEREARKKMDRATRVDSEMDEEGSDEELDEMDESDIDSEDDDEYSDIEDEADTEDNDEEDDEEELPEAKNKPLPKKAATSAKSAPAKKSKPIAQTFEVEEDWEEETNTKSSQNTSEAVQQLKKKLKASKRPIASGWTESPLKTPTEEKEIEIVIPSKRAKTKEKVQELPQSDDEVTNGRNRRVKIVLKNNTAQDPKDYHESIRKSPGLPHDPDRQPSRGGVLKRNAAGPLQKLSFDQPKRATRTRKN